MSRTVVRNSAWGMGAQLAIKVLSFAFSVLVVRTLGAEAFGQYAGVLAFGAVFVFVADLGLSPYVVREVARWRDADDGPARTAALYGNVLLLRLVLSLVASGLLIGTAWLSGRPTEMVVAIALGAVGLVIYSAHGASDALLQGLERLDVSGGARVLQQVVFVLLGALALWGGLGYRGLILAQLVGIALMTRLCWRAVARLGVRPTRPSLGAWVPLLRASVPFAVIGFTLGLSYRFDSVLLTLFRSDAETGYYNSAYNLVFSAAVLSNAVNTALYPSLTRNASVSPEMLRPICERALRYLMALGLPIAVAGWALADELVPTLYSAAYLPAVPALQLVVWVIPLMFASELLGYVALILGDERRAARSLVASTVVNVGLNIVLVPTFGYLAAAAMTVATEALLVAQYLVLLRAPLSGLDWGRTVGRPAAAAAGMGIVILLVRSLPLVAVVPIAGLAYGALLLALGVAGRDELTFLKSLRRPAVAAQPA